MFPKNAILIINFRCHGNKTDIKHDSSAYKLLFHYCVSKYQNGIKVI
jgi:hypothetical protein